MMVSDAENRELKLAGEFVAHTGCHIFLTGKAGTGKTTFLKQLSEHSPKRLVVTAPTGVAAINAGGVTLHSFFQLPFGPYIPGSDAYQTNRERIFRFSKEKKQIIKSLDLLVIDEISMVRADVLDAVDNALQYHRRSNQPFGGAQLLMIGDLHQLPPVAQPDEWELLRQYYPSPYFFSSTALSRVDLITIELTKVYRQSDDRFVALLNQVRENRLDPAGIRELNRRHIEDFGTREGYITLCTHNRQADSINRDKLGELTEKTWHLDADVSGEFPEHGFPTFARLELKTGAQVMFLRNDPSPEKLYFNGKIGRITALSAGEIHVRCQGETREIRVEPAEWENVKYSLDEERQEIRQEVIGRFKQFPLKPAWAITIHKSQGLTFDRAVIDARAAFAQGQVYVALSRCRTLEGMVLSSPIPAHGIDMDEAVRQFLRAAAEAAPPEERLLEEQIGFQQQLVMECFDFQELNNRLNYLCRLLSGNADVIQISGVTDMDGLQRSAREQIISVGEKFKRQLLSRFSADCLPESDPYIRERVTKASAWFKEKFTGIFDDFMKIFSVETDNKAIRKKIKNATENLQLVISVKHAGIAACESGFACTDYLRAVSKAAIEFSPAKPRKAQVPVYGESQIEHPDLFQQLRQWRLDTARKKGIPAFQILHQQVLIQIVVHLPDSIAALKAIKGVGPKTVENYGDAIVSRISAYRKAHGIESVTLPELPLDMPETSAPEKKPGKKPEVNPKAEKERFDTRKASYDLFQKGMTVEQIATERGLVTNTIQGHLAAYVETGDVDIDQLLPTEKQDRIREGIAGHLSAPMKTIKSRLDDDVSYGDILLMMAHLRRDGGEKT